MKPDEHAVGPKPEGVADHVTAGRNVKDTMLRDSLLNDSGLVGRSIALRTKGSQIDPCRDRRHAPDGVRRGWRHRFQRLGIVAGLDFSGCARRLKREAMRKDFHPVYLPGSGKLAAALAKTCKDRHLTADDALEINLGHPAVFIADQDGRAADVFKARVFYPKLVGILRVDRDGGGNIPELIVDQRQSRFILPDRRLALAVESRVDQRELPGSRWLARQDAISAAVKMQILSLVPYIVESRQAGSNLEIHVGQIPVLGDVKTNSDGRGVVAADLEIDIAHRGIKGAGIRIRDRLNRRNRSGGRRRRPKSPPREGRAGRPPVRPGTSEKEHITDPLLEPRSLKIGRHTSELQSRS